MRTVLLIALFALKLFAQTGNLEGIILNATGEPLAYADVNLKELQIKKAANSKGEFMIKNLPFGNYTLIVSSVGYATENIKVTIDEKRVFVKIALREKAVNLGEAVVIGEKETQAEKNTAIPFENVSFKELQAEQAATIGDALEKKAGVNVARDGVWGTMINVRGLSKQNLVYLVDGARIETSTNIAGGASLFDLGDVEKIEVIKGGLSTLYGSGASGGVVNVITRQPHFSQKTYFTGTVSGGYETVNKGYAAHLTLLAGAPKWKAKFSASKRNASDAQTPDGTLENSSFNDYSYSASLGYAFTENLELSVGYQNFKANDVGIPGGSAFPANAFAKYKEASRALFNSKIIWRNPAKYLNVLSLNYYNQFIRRIVEISPAPGIFVTPSSDHRTNGFVLQGESVFSINYLIAGIDAWERTYEGIRQTYKSATNETIVDKSIPNSSFSSLGFFARDKIYLGEKIDLTLGGRYDFIRIENEAVNNPLYKIIGDSVIVPPSNPAASFDASNITNKSWSANLDLLYRLNENLNLTFAAAKSFRSPSLEERFQYINLGGIIYLGNPDLEPERNLSFDFGVNFYDDKFSARAHLFSNYFDNLVIDAAVNPDSLYVKQNVGQARFYGFDATFQFKLCKSLIEGTLAYVNGKDTEKDEPLPQIPPLNGSLFASAPILNTLYFTMRGTFYADQNDVPPTEERTPGYAVYDLELKSFPIDLSNVTINIYGGIKNLLNRKYKNHLSTYRGINPYEPGRNFYLKLAARF